MNWWDYDFRDLDFWYQPELGWAVYDYPFFHWKIVFWSLNNQNLTTIKKNQILQIKGWAFHWDWATSVLPPSLFQSRSAQSIKRATQHGFICSMTIPMMAMKIVWWWLIKTIGYYYIWQRWKWWHFLVLYFQTWSLGALRAPTSSRRTFGPLDFVLRALRLKFCHQRTNQRMNKRTRRF